MHIARPMYRPGLAAGLVPGSTSSSSALTADWDVLSISAARRITGWNNWVTTACTELRLWQCNREDTGTVYLHPWTRAAAIPIHQPQLDIPRALLDRVCAKPFVNAYYIIAFVQSMEYTVLKEVSRLAPAELSELAELNKLRISQQNLTETPLRAYHNLSEFTILHQTT